MEVSKKNILLVEDEAVTARLTSQTLRKFGYNVIAAYTGEEAIKIVSDNKDINLILMDIDLGEGIDGTEAAAIILKDYEIPVVFLSSHTEPEIVEKTEKITSYGYVVKASNSTVLDASIKMAFKLFDAKLKEKDKEDKYQNLLENLNDVFFIIEVSGAISFVSPQAVLLSQYTVEEIIGRNFTDFIHPDDRPELIKKFPLVLEGVKDPWEFRIIRKDSAVRYVRTSGNLIKKKGKVAGLITLMTDITESKLAEEKIRINSDELKAANYELHAAMEELEAANEELIRTNQEMMKADDLLRESEARYKTLVEKIPQKVFMKNRDSQYISINENFARDLGIKSDEIIGRSDSDLFPGDPELAAKYRADDLRIMETGQAEELVEKYLKNGEETWVQTIKTAIKDNSGRITGVCGVFRDITERKQMEAALVESEERYRTLVDNANEAILVAQDGVLKFVNRKAVETMQGYTRQELLTKSFIEFVHPDDKLKVAENNRKRMSGEAVPPKYEFRILTGKKDTYWVEINSSFIKWNGKPAVLSFLTDITERKKTEDSLMASQRRLSDIIDFLPDATLAIDRDRRVIIWNKAIEKMTGIQASDMIGKGDYAYTVPFYGKARQQLMDLAFEDHEEVAIRYPSIKREGESIVAEAFCNALYDNKGAWVYAKASPLHDQSGNIIGAIESIRDITERKKDDEKIKMLSFSLEQIQDRITISDPDGEIIYLNQLKNESISRKRYENIGHNIAEYTSDKPDDISRKQLNDIIEQTKSEGQWRGDIIRYGDDGRKYIMDCRSYRILDDNGKIIAITGIATDITERKESEEKIKSLLKEKELILREVHHRIKNNMNVIYGLLILQAERLKDPAGVAALEDSANRVQSMMVLYDKLYRSNDFQTISVKDYISPLVDEITSIYPETGPVEIRKKIDDFILDTKRLQPLGMIINELLSNILKYAFVGRDSGVITISVLLNKNTVSLVVEDNGKGIPESVDFENSTGFGLQLISLLARELKGSVRIERVNGTKVVLDFEL
jgi:PAS domain S-box-containing protein